MNNEQKQRLLLADKQRRLESLIEPFIAGAPKKSHRAIAAQVNLTGEGNNKVVAHRNGDVDMPAAGIAKLPVAMAAIKSNPDMNMAFKKFQPRPERNEPSLSMAYPAERDHKLRDLVAMSIAGDDNAAHSCLLDHVNYHGDGIEAYLNQILGEERVTVVDTPNCDGRDPKRSRKNRTTANEALELVALARRDRHFQKELSSRIMPNCLRSDRLPARVRHDAKVSHKNGTLRTRGIINDAGFIDVVSSSRPSNETVAPTVYLACLTSGEHDLVGAEDAIAHVAGELSEAFQ